MSSGPSASATPRTTSATLHGARAVALVIALVLGVMSYQLNASMLSPALPDMARQLGTDVSSISNVSSVFFLAGAVASVFFTRWSDYIGRRRGIIIVLAVLVTGTLLCVFAPNLPVLLLGRVLQGASNATFNFAYLVLAERLSAKVFGVAIGFVAAINGGVAGLDGLLGGYLTDHVGYQAIFLVVLAVGVLAVVATFLAVPKDAIAPRWGGMDWWGFAILAVGIVCLNNAISTAGEDGLGSAWFAIYAAAAVIAFVGFWAVEHRMRDRAIIAPHHLKSRQVWPVLMTTVLALAGMVSFTSFTIVVLAENTDTGFGLSATETALLFLSAPAITGMITAPIAGWIAGRTDWVRVLRTGMLACLVLLVAASVSSSSMWAMFAIVALLGVSLNGIVYPSLNGLSVLLSPPEAPAALPGLNGACFGIGAGLGITTVAPFVGSGDHAGIVTAITVSAGFTLLAVVATFLVRRAGAPHPVEQAA